MADEVFVSSTTSVVVDDSWYVGRDTEHHDVVLAHKRTGRIWGVGYHQARLALRLARRMINNPVPNAARVALVGMGLGNLLRVILMKNWTTPPDCFEQEQVVVSFFQQEFHQMAARVNVITGDFRTTMTALYDVIVYDASDAPSDAERSFLLAHRRSGGVVLIPPNWTVMT